jgi:beta-fructofuranosidase
MNNSSEPSSLSRVPRYTFSDTLAGQQVQLATNPMLERFRASRQKLASDPYRPLYHFVSPESGLNDPNGLCFWQGNWHLFYQTNPPEEPSRPHWGHAISTDLIHWRDLPHAIHPSPERMSFSGSTLVEENRVIAIYHGVGVGNMIAIASDPLLLNWRKLTGKAVIPEPCEMWNKITGKEVTPGLSGNPAPVGAMNFMYDPCIWKKEGFYYALSGGIMPHEPSGKRMRAEFLFRSSDLKTWEYLHSFIEGDIFGETGDDGGCPYFWPIGDRHILLHFSHRSGGKYVIGDYDVWRDKFIATAGGSFTFGSFFPGGVHAPSATPDGKGGVIAIFNMNMAKPTPGWDQLMSLPRRLTLIGKDDLGVEPVGDIGSLRGAHQQVAARTLPANQELVLDNIHGNTMEIIAEIDPKNAPMIELTVLRSPGKEEFTRISFFKQRGYRNWERAVGGFWDHNAIDSLISIDTSRSSCLPDVLSRAPETAPFHLPPGENLKLRIFIDKSVIEVFVNSRQCASVRVYPGRADSLGVSVMAQGQEASLINVDAWQMKSIYGGKVDL